MVKLRKEASMAKSHLIPTFVPALVAILLNQEHEKGRPLTEDEVLEIRDKGACIMLPPDEARALSAGRGYDDIDPENVWEEWQRVRAEIAASGPDAETGSGRV
jgi:hypothetical protein